MPADPAAFQSGRRNRKVAAAAGVVVVLMLGLSFAAVPLYRIFCARTGLAGTTQVATAGAATQGQRRFEVRFDTNVANGLPIAFEPEVASVEVRTGQTATVFFKATNRSDHAIVAQAHYNVTPYVMGLYFAKITCFCFTETRLEPGRTLEMPVVFFLDPALEKDETIANIDAVTLSYTFSLAADPVRPMAESPVRGGAKL